MYDHIKEYKPDITKAEMCETKVTAILEASIDVVDFMFDLEDNLDLEQEELDMKTLIPKIQEANFLKLAEEIKLFINTK